MLLRFNLSRTLPGDGEGPTAPLTCYEHRFLRFIRPQTRPGKLKAASVPVREFRLADAGICLATRSDPDEATREMTLGRGLVADVREGSVPRFLTVKFGSTLPLLRDVGCLLSSKKVLLPLSPVTRCLP